MKPGLLLLGDKRGVVLPPWTRVPQRCTVPRARNLWRLTVAQQPLSRRRGPQYAVTFETHPYRMIRTTKHALEGPQLKVPGGSARCRALPSRDLPCRAGCTAAGGRAANAVRKQYVRTRARYLHGHPAGRRSDR